MQIVIVGDGKIGSALAEQLSREGHEITIVDRSGAPLQCAVWLDKVTLIPLYGEFSQNGQVVLTARMTAFSCTTATEE